MKKIIDQTKDVDMSSVADKKLKDVVLNPFTIASAMENQTGCDLALVMFTDEEMYMKFEWQIDGLSRSITRTIDITEFLSKDPNSPIARTLDEVCMLAKGIH